MLPLLALLFTSGELLPDPGFEQGSSWLPFESGFVVDREVTRSGTQSIRCSSDRDGRVFGASVTLLLDQTVAKPVEVSGWSKASGVGGAPDADYSIYVDAIHQDGSPLWGTNAPFDVGTHGWQRRRVVVASGKPFRSVTVYALFRRHAGTVWFDDFSARELSDNDLFDFQGTEWHVGAAGKAALRASGAGLSLGFDGAGLLVEVAGQKATTPGGFYWRPFENGGRRMEALAGRIARSGRGFLLRAGSSDGRLSLAAELTPGRSAWRGEAVCTNRAQGDLVGTLYFLLPVVERRPVWWDHPRASRFVAEGTEATNAVPVPYGSNGLISRYPYTCVQGERGAHLLAEGFESPVAFRLFFNPKARVLALAWDVAFPPGRRVSLRFDCGRLSGERASWGFRAATDWFYGLHPELRNRRVDRTGIWMPFKSPSEVRGVQDFGVAFHEGDNSVEADDGLGVLSFRYTEPMSFWMPMEPALPRTYDSAIEQLGRLARGSGPLAAQAKAALRCAARDKDGRLQVEFRSEPWCDGAVFLLNASPRLGGSADDPTKAWLNYNPQDAERWHPTPRMGDRGLDGQYLDSLEGWGERLDYSPDHRRLCPFPATFDRDGSAVVPLWYHSYDFAASVSADLRRRGYLLFANAVPLAHPLFCRLLDVMGVETNWAWEGRYEPDSDSVMLFRRVFSGSKPYLLLLNTDFDAFPAAWMRRYVDRCAFYGILPSMFSPDAATRVYWDRPDLVERDRELFRNRVPTIAALCNAGWEPITFARSSDARLWLERFGGRFLTVFNPASEAVTATLQLQRSGFPLRPKTVVDRIGGGSFPVRWQGASGMMDVRLEPEQTMVLDGGRP
ncbi:MAG: hypothetical protein N2109_00980 [Fimbriimonadales bacterium]|nr:hypothetical protein [Fimbriimonadales bacterium]